MCICNELATNIGTVLGKPIGIRFSKFGHGYKLRMNTVFFLRSKHGKFWQI